MQTEVIYQRRLQSLAEQLTSGVPFLKWKYTEVARFDITHTSLVCGCAIAESACLFRNDNPALYAAVETVAVKPYNVNHRPPPFALGFTPEQWNTLQKLIEDWYGLTTREFNFLFMPLTNSNSILKGSWFTESATKEEIAKGIYWMLQQQHSDDDYLPTRNDEDFDEDFDFDVDLSNDIDKA